MAVKRHGSEMAVWGVQVVGPWGGLDGSQRARARKELCESVWLWWASIAFLERA